MGNMINSINVKTGMTLKEYAEDGWLEANLVSAEINTVRDYAFTNNEAMQTVDFPNVTSIGAYAFNSCKNLTSFNYSKVNTIKHYAFQSCNITGDLILPLLKLNSLNGNYAFNNNKLITSVNAPLTTIIPHSCFAGCTSLQNVSLPSVENFNDWCFSSCTALEELTLPMAEIFTRYVFRASGLKKLVLPKNVVAKVASDTFLDTPIAKGMGYVYVPDNLLDSYKSATNWSAIADQIRPISMLYADDPIEWIDAEYNTMAGHNDSATTLVDLSGNGNNGTINGTLSYANKGYIFDGNEANYISSNAISALSNVNEITIEMCYRVAELTGTQRILYADGFYENYYRDSENGLIVLSYFDELPNEKYIYTLAANELVTVSTTFKANNKTKMYINGTLVQEFDATESSIAPTAINIGQGRSTYPISNGSKFYSLRIYNRELDQVEITQNYQNDVTRFSA